MEEARQVIAARLNAARTAKGIGLKSAADAMSLPKQTFVDIESGRGTLTVGRLLDYARMLGVKPVDLVPELLESVPLPSYEERLPALRAVDVLTLIGLSGITGRVIVKMFPELTRVPR